MMNSKTTSSASRSKKWPPSTSASSPFLDHPEERLQCPEVAHFVDSHPGILSGDRAESFM
jgi:hypothetical protein